MKLRCLTSVLLTSLSLLISSPQCWAKARQSVSSAGRQQIAVTLRPASDNSATLGRISKRIGRVFVRNTTTHTYRLVLDRGISAKSALRLLRPDSAVQSVAVVKPGATRVVNKMASVRSIQHTLNALENRAEAKGEGREKGEESGTDYLRAWKYWFNQRAFPFDRIPSAAYRNAVAHRAKMKRAPLGKNKGGIGILSVGGAWEFVGPRNLGVDSRLYSGPSPVSGRVNAVAFDPNTPGTYYAGAAGGGLWVTNDSGVNWTPLGDGWNFLQVSSIAVDPTDSQTIYVGTGDYDGFGVYSFGLQKTTDGGLTWQTLGANEFAGSAISHVVVDPDDPQKVTVSTGRSFNWGSSNIWHSTDGGLTWAQAFPTQANWQGMALGVVGPKARRYMFAVSDNLDLLRSTDRGATWTPLVTPIQNPGEATLAMSSHDFATIYLSSSADQRIYKSIDSGETWSDISGVMGADTTETNYWWSQSWYDMVLGTAFGYDKWGLPEDVIYLGLIDNYQQFNEIVDWRSIGLGLTDNARVHVDHHAFDNNHLDPTESLVGSDGGAYRYLFDQTSGSIEFDSLNANLGITQFYKADWHPTDPNIMVGGSQDNATPFSNGDIDNWNSTIGGDGGGSQINFNNPLIQFGTVYGAQVFRTGNGWQSFSNITPDTSKPVQDNLPFVTIIKLDPNDPNVMYLGTNYLWQWNDLTQTWNPRIGGQKLAGIFGVISAIDVFKGDRDRIYTGSDDGMVWMSTEFRVWTQLNRTGNGLPERSITSLSVNPNNKDDLLVGVSGFGTGHLWRCDDTRAITPVFTDASGTGADALPDVPVNGIARDPFDPEYTWYVATDVGVFMTSDQGATWTNATAPLGLPNVQVNDIKAVPGTGFLNVATYGRGMWRIGLETDKAFVDSLTIDPNTICDGNSVTATVKLRYPASAGGAVVDITTSNPTVTTVPAQVTVPQGVSSVSFTVLTKPVTTDTPVTITASVAKTGTSASALLTVKPFTVNGISISPNPVFYAQTATGTVTLTCTSTKPGTVTLTSSNTTVATVPASVSVPANTSTITFTATPKITGVGKSTTITATLNGKSVSVVLKVEGILDTFTLTPNKVLAGQFVTGTVTLRIPAPAGGVVVNFASADTTKATVPASILIPQGGTNGSITVASKAVPADTTVVITASSVGNSRSATLTLVSKIIPTLTLNPNPVKGSFNCTGTVKLNVIAPVGGVTFALASGIPAIARVPDTVTVPGGQTSATFTISTSAVGISTDVGISATYQTAVAKAILTVLPNSYPKSQQFKPNPACANSFSIGTLTLNGAAPIGGATVSLNSSDPNVATVPANVYVPAGLVTATYTISTKDVLVDSDVTITATFAGVSNKGILTVKASVLTSCTISPSTIKGGNNVTLTLNTSCPAPAGGAIVTLTTSDANVVDPPTSVIIPAGQTAANFTLNTKGVANATLVTITATYHGTTRSATVTVSP